jgi:hypothetical protein
VDLQVLYLVLVVLVDLRVLRDQLDLQVQHLGHKDHRAYKDQLDRVVQLLGHKDLQVLRDQLDQVVQYPDQLDLVDLLEWE